VFPIDTAKVRILEIRLISRVSFRGIFYCMRLDKCTSAKIHLISIGFQNGCIGACRMALLLCVIDGRVSILRSALVNAINFTVYESLRKEIAVWDAESIGR
jgi:hypothetical protein